MEAAMERQKRLIEDLVVERDTLQAALTESVATGMRWMERYNAAAVDLAAAREAVGEMWAALAELVEVAGLRGDSTLPNPCDDPLLWTVRMQEAWDAAEEAVAKHTPTPGAPEVRDV